MKHNYFVEGSMDRREVQPRWGWLILAIILFVGVLMFRESVQDMWGRGLLFLWGLLLVALCFVKSNAPPR